MRQPAFAIETSVFFSAVLSLKQEIRNIIGKKHVTSLELREEPTDVKADLDEADINRETMSRSKYMTNSD